MTLSRLLEAPVRAAIEEVAALGPTAAAVFDADGTLWAGDLGEELLRDLVRAGRVPRANGRDAYAEYERLLASDPPGAFRWCVEVMRGLAGDEVCALSQRIYRERFAPRLFPGVRAALEALGAAGVDIYVVSASNALSIRAAVVELGLRAEHVLAVECPVDADGRLTGEVPPPVTCSAGKVVAIERALGARRPDIAFGNSLFDREMLAHSGSAVLVAPRGQESLALAEARRCRWLVHEVDAFD